MNNIKNNLTTSSALMNMNMSIYIQTLLVVMENPRAHIIADHHNKRTQSSRIHIIRDSVNQTLVIYWTRFPKYADVTSCECKTVALIVFCNFAAPDLHNIIKNFITASPDGEEKRSHSWFQEEVLNGYALSLKSDKKAQWLDLIP